MLIKYALVDFSPVEVAFFQAAIGAVGLLTIVLFQGGSARAMLRDILRRPFPALVLGALGIAAPFFLGAVAVLGAAASGAISNFVVKLQYRDKNVPPTTTTFFSLSVGAVLVAPFAFITASGDAPGARSSSE